MSKILKFNDEARSSISNGIEKLANAVKVTLGPRGRNVAIDKPHGYPHITKDGVSVAESITLPDPFENMGSQMVKEVAGKTNEMAGDGTTTATVLAEAIYKEGLKNITAGANPIELKRGIDQGIKDVVNTLKNDSIDVSTNDEVKQIGVISANGDEMVGEMIAEAMDVVGKNGTISVLPSKSIESSLNVVKGMYLDGSGYLSPYFATDAKTLNTELDDALILLYEDKITNMMELVPLLQRVSSANRSLLIIAEDVEGEALSTMVMNNLKGTISVCCIKAPYFGEMRSGIMSDISILTGAKYITKDLGLKLADVQLTDLGSAGHITVDKNSTTIADGHGDKENIDSRVESLNTLLVDAEDQYVKNQLTDRVAKLTGGVAILNIGGSTETEMMELKDRVDDALSAVRAGVEEGVVAGGGVALLNAVKCLQNTPTTEMTSDMRIGYNIVMEACKYPFNTIMANAGLNGDVILSEVDRKPEGFGYDARSGQYVNMVDSGIIDPVKVTRLALENASSIAGLLLTTEVIITDDPESKKNANTQPQMMV